MGKFIGRRKDPQGMTWRGEIRNNDHEYVFGQIVNMPDGSKTTMGLTSEISIRNWYSWDIVSEPKEKVFRKSENGVIWEFVEEFEKLSTANAMIYFVIAKNVETGNQAGMTKDRWVEMEPCEEPAKEKVVTLTREHLDYLLRWAREGYVRGSRHPQVFMKLSEIEGAALSTLRGADDDE